ncbi:hypothetical protein B1C78_03165 [Thioalkalivibrio denitrificans]|uniref:DUF2946 domain-containing protein n=1 Tax=Thioalkalivibrio denitrificans TaxID=108003 RepID=A0A1V3NSF6_9GAMM|nr:hypothetical protein [Thioalkalivibrio denitrificans]OOG27666.1 hypothetical protein B1C78_03165 [Thioalkalivibrio denitrificans]
MSVRKADRAGNRRYRGVWLAALAALAHLWMPVLHAQHAGPSEPLIPAHLHGVLCLAAEPGRFADDGAEGFDPHRLMDCECLTCKVMHTGAPPGFIAMELPEGAVEPLPPPGYAAASAAPVFARPPARAPPSNRFL